MRSPGSRDANVCSEDSPLPKAGDGKGPIYGVSYGRRWRELVPEDFDRMNLGKRYAKFGLRRQVQKDQNGNVLHDERGAELLEGYGTYLGRLVELVKDESARRPIRNYLENIQEFFRQGAGLLFVGRPGIGKSTAAAIIGMVAVRWGFSVYFVSHAELQELRFQKEFEQDVIDGLPVMERVRKVDLLVLDDFNEDFVDDRKFGPLETEKLISRRNANVKPTILTTRVAFKQEKRVHALFGVTQETMLGLQLKGDDLRERAGEKLRQKLMKE